MKHAYVFPGQGAQAVGMGKDLYDNVPEAKELFEKANEILGFRITDIMFAGTDEELKQTKVTQPAVFLHSVIMAKALGVPPFALSQLTRRAGRRTMAQLKKQLALCVNADFDIKRGAVREEAALDRLMLALTEK